MQDSQILYIYKRLLRLTISVTSMQMFNDLVQVMDFYMYSAYIVSKLKGAWDHSNNVTMTDHQVNDELILKNQKELLK